MLTRGQKARRSQQQLDAIQALSGHVLELGPVATLLVLQLSVRQLWLLKRVNRYFRRMATAALMTMKRPVVGGGIPQEGGQQSIELLDLGSLRWSVKVLLPAARTDAAMTLMSDGTMMMAGGDISPESERASLRGWTVTNGVECYAPATQTWASMPRLNTERTSLRLVCCPNGRVLALGGCDDVENDTASVEGLDPCADAWIELAPMRTARHSFACACTTSGMVVAAGGQDRHGEDLQVRNDHARFSRHDMSTRSSSDPEMAAGRGGVRPAQERLDTAARCPRRMPRRHGRLGDGRQS